MWEDATFGATGGVRYLIQIENGTNWVATVADPDHGSSRLNWRAET